MTDTTTATETGETGSETGEQKQAETFTKAQVDAIVNQRLKQQAQNKFGDYDELKDRAGQTKTLEERLAEVEKRASDAESKALRSDVAARHGISAEDRDLFLTGSDEDTLTAQAQRLAARSADVKKHGNVAPKEGETKTTGSSEEAEAKEFVSNLFGGGSD